MASLVKRSQTFYAQWRDANRRPVTRRHSLRTGDREAAARLLREADAAYRLGGWDPWVDPISVLDERPAEYVRLGAAVERFLGAREGMLRAVTLSNYESLLSRFAAGVGGPTPLARVGPEAVRSFACAPGLKASTMHTRLVVLRAFWNWAVREGLDRRNPAELVDAPPVPAALPKAVSLEELGAVVVAIEADQDRRDSADDARVHTDRLWLVPCFRLAFYCGLRAAELSRLTWGDVDLEKRRVRLEVQKNGEAGYLPISTKASSVLAEMPGGGDQAFVFCPPCSVGLDRNVRAFATNLNRYFRQYAEAAGIGRRVTLHGLRHGFCSHLAERGAEAFTIRSAARHADVRTSQRYVAIAGARLRESLDEAFG